MTAGEISWADSEVIITVEKVQELLDYLGIKVRLNVIDTRRYGLEGAVLLSADMRNTCPACLRGTLRVHSRYEGEAPRPLNAPPGYSTGLRRFDNEFRCGHCGALWRNVGKIGEIRIERIDG